MENTFKFPRVRFFGNPKPGSGYGNATRIFARCFDESNICTKFVFPKSSYRDFETSLKGYEGDTDVDFYIHCPPYDKHRSKNYKIGYFYWEADKLPHGWGRSIKSLNEVWSPCDLVTQACIKSGYDGIIRKIPTPADKKNSNAKIRIPSEVVPNSVLDDETFVFYSIFQWNYRKGYDALLRAYYEEFSDHDNCILVVKTNPLGNVKKSKQDMRKQILSIKKSIDKRLKPKIFLSDSIVDDDIITSLHILGDCFVLPYRGEGWGMPIHDAIVHDSELIITKFGGVSEYLDDDSANIISHKLVPVKNMSWSSYYNDSQRWAEPSVPDLKRKMRIVYENRGGGLSKVVNAKKIVNNMNSESMIKLLEKEFSAKRFKRFS